MQNKIKTGIQFEEKCRSYTEIYKNCYTILNRNL